MSGFTHFLSARRMRKRHSRTIIHSPSLKTDGDTFTQVAFNDKELQLFDKNNTLSHKKKKTSRHSKSTDFQLVSLIDAQEAKLSDIPVPLHAKRIIDAREQSGEDIFLRYGIQMQLGAIKQFYMQEMERLGWQYNNSFDGVELLLIFKKPHRSCAISIRPQKKRTDLVIFVSYD